MMMARYDHCGWWFRAVARYTLDSPSRGLETSGHPISAVRRIYSIDDRAAIVAFAE